MLSNFRSYVWVIIFPICFANIQQLSVEYSFAETRNYQVLGSITIERTYDGNYTGFFMPKIDSKILWQEMQSAAKDGSSYLIRSENNRDFIEAFNEPCLMLHAGLGHQFRLTIDPDQHALLSLSVFPEGLFVVGSDYQTCSNAELPPSHKLRGSVAVTKLEALPTPDTESYIQKLEKERQARQQGAQQDNRSWLQKYWMYIAAAFIFMVIMNATTGDQGD